MPLPICSAGWQQLIQAYVYHDARYPSEQHAHDLGGDHSRAGPEEKAYRNISDDGSNRSVPQRRGPSMPSAFDGALRTRTMKGDPSHRFHLP